MKELLFVLVLLAVGAAAHERPAPSPVPADTVKYPSWCHDYPRRVYQKELRACHGDRLCRFHARQKARKCGLR